MIVDYIENYGRYVTLLPHLEKGIKFALSLKEAPLGRYEQESFYALVQEGYTLSLEEGYYETHKKYADVQIIIDGQEIVEWQNAANLTIHTGYDEERDITFLEGEGVPILIRKNMFYLVFPEDAHKPCRHVGESYRFRKIVLKMPCL